MTAYRLFIPGMVCPSAVDHIERTLRNCRGVREVEPQTLEHVVRVELEWDNGVRELVRAVERVGFQVAACLKCESLPAVPCT